MHNAMSTSVSLMSLALIFDKLNIDTGDVLAAAGTKWEFFTLQTRDSSGGHCISVDPYYLAHKAQEVGHDPQVILSGRRINDSMGLHVASSGAVVKLLASKRPARERRKSTHSRSGLQRKIPAMYATLKSLDVLSRTKSFGMEVDVFDPLANPAQALREYGIELGPADRFYQSTPAIRLAVPHQSFYYAGHSKLHPNAWSMTLMGFSRART